MNFEIYFSEDKIIKILCSYRAKQATKRHNMHMVRNFSLHPSNNIILSSQDYKEFIEIAELFPSRRNWKKLYRDERKIYNDSLKANEARLYNSYKATKKAVSNGEIPPLWYTNLVNYISEIRDKIINVDSEDAIIDSPEITGIKKDEKNGKITYRPIAVYDTKSKIICSLTAKYFTDFFDEYFLPCSYAFRSVKGKKKIPSHHDCIQKIATKRKQNAVLWAAECDIQKFFDIVNHKHLLEVFEKLVEHVKLINGKIIDPLSITLLKLFLSSYSFKNNVLKLNEDAKWFESRNLPLGKFGWVEDSLKEAFYDNYCEENSIGIPQGNAISCFIANLILHDVDKKVLASVKDIFYIRYCDDMILLHEDKAECEKALSVFMKGLNDNFLLFHPPSANLDYKKQSSFFWNESKSKFPYFWGNKNTSPTNIPWLAFVGYQINFEGKIRVRKKTLTKETKKQIQETEKIIINLGKLKHYQNVSNNHSRWSKRQILFSLQQRLISMSVGRIKIYNHKEPLTQGLCWTNGFKVLKRNKIVSKQLRYLDRKRRHQLLRLKTALKKIDKKSEKTTFEENKIFYGSAFSYYNFLKNK